jgi:nucleoside-diphosphate-sugar epimerase
MLPQILILGATGRTGRLVLDEALKRGHFVTALIRKPNSDLTQHQNLTIVRGDPCQASDIGKALESAKPAIPIVIISTLGQTRTSGNPWAATTSPARFMATSIEAVLSGAQSFDEPARIQKLVVLSMFGAGDSFGSLNCMMQWIMKSSNMAQTLEDHNLVDKTVKAGGLPFVLVRPAMLKDADAAPLKFYGDTGKGSGFMPSASMRSVADFLLEVTVDGKYDGTTPMIAN